MWMRGCWLGSRDLSPEPFTNPRSVTATSKGVFEDALTSPTRIGVVGSVGRSESSPTPESLSVYKSAGHLEYNDPFYGTFVLTVDASTWLEE